MRAEQITEPVADRATSPIWWDRHQTLRLVDAATGEVLALAGDRITRIGGRAALGLHFRLGGGAVVMRRSDLGLSNFEDLSDLAGICSLAGEYSYRSSACDPDGGLWLSIDSAGLHQLDVGSLRPRKVLPDLIADHLLFSPDTTTLYAVDAATTAVMAFDYDPIRSLSRQRVFLAPQGPIGGVCMDASGGVWVSRPGTGQVRRHLPDGSISEVIEVGTTQVAGCCFGGPDLQTLFVTSSRLPNSANDPHSGAIFAATPGAQGAPHFGFAG